MSLNHLFAREDYGFGCPDGGEWYSCGSGTKFVGCCTKDPCNDVGCGDGTLKKATFDSSKYGEFPDLSCNAGSFYTCNFTSPPFWGCCLEPPCGRNTTGCLQSDLAAAFLPNNAAQASPYSPTGGPSTTATSTATSAPSSGDDSHGTGTVIGAAIGGAVAGCLILGVAIWFCLRHRRKTRAKQIKDDITAEEIPAVKPELSASDSVRIKRAVYPPRYSSIVNTEAFELEDTGRGTSELQGDDASHIRPELDGSDVGDTMSEVDGSSAPSSPRGLRRSAMVAAARVKKLAPSHGGGGDEKSELSVSAHGSPKSSPSPHSMSFPRDTDSAVSSEASSPLTPRFLAPHASPKHPPIIEETREDHG